MKFYCASKLLNRVEAQEYTLLYGVDIKTGGSGYIKKNNWGSGWIFDADESFRSWCAIAYGFDVVHITDQEFHLLEVNDIVYLSKERTLEVRKPLMAQLSLISLNA